MTQNIIALDVRHIAHALGGEVYGRDAVACPGPGHSPKDRSLSIRLDPTAPDGFLIYSHAGDDWRDCRDYVRARLGLPRWEPGEEQRRNVPPHHVEKWDLAAVEAEGNGEPHAWSEDEILRIAAARRIWDEARNPSGTLAEKYLREHRKLDLPDDLPGRVLRFHPACPWRNENTGRTDRVPALIVPFRSIDDDAVTAVHRIALRGDGTKIDRRMLGIVSRTAIKLDAPAERLAIGEGLETAMAARQLGYRPAWALGSVGAISFFPLIDRVKQLLILGEPGGASARAIKFCGSRWRKAGRRVRVVMPEAPFSDLNDILIAEKAS
jgi:putative DNA primase/helicase